MDVKIKNIKKSEKLNLKTERLTLFSFWKGEEISTHESMGDAMVQCLDGVGRITIDGIEHELHEGDTIVMPAGHPHAVFGVENFKMLLTVIF